MNNERFETSPPLDQLYFYLTGGCNQQCRHCWIAPKFQSDSGSGPVLSVELLKSIIAQAKTLGLTGVKLTGGEPLLHPAIGEILEYIRAQEIELTIETNGVLCTAELARQIAACKDPFVSISLDGADAETHEWVRGVPGCFDAALEGVHNLVQAGIRPQIIMSLMRCNQGQMESVVRLAESFQAQSVKFNLIQPTARGKRLYTSGEALSIHELVELGTWAEKTLAGSTGLPVVYDHPAAFHSLSSMFGEKGRGCSSCGMLGILGVLADGSYALCGIGENVSELVFGHAAEDCLKDVWDKTALLNELRAGLSERLEGVCGDCLMKNLCLGSCIAQNYYRSRNLWAPFWFCEAADRAGLFPETRRRLKAS
jgi:SynChlorMet cassette radical SAM/SPASM protein ScmF